MQEKVEIITNHIVQFWTILDKNTQKWILCMQGEEYAHSITACPPGFEILTASLICECSLILILQ